MQRLLETQAPEPARSSLRVALVSEALAGVSDEATKRFAHELVEHLGPLCDVRAIAVGETEGSESDLLAVPRSRTFLQPQLRRLLRDWLPDAVCYLPTAALTASAALRARVLSLHARAPVALVALQQRKYGAVSRQIVRSAGPDLVFTQSHGHAQALTALGCRVSVLPPAIDTTRFRPAASEEKRRLRLQYGLPLDALVVLHVGHMKRERNVEVLAGLTERSYVVFVSAKTMGLDPVLQAELEGAGVHVASGYVDSIESLYQAADCYLFPVLAQNGAIELPLSVLEAMATDLPVITTRFGGLSDVLGSCDGLTYVETEDDIRAALTDRAWMEDVQTREAVSTFSWDALAAAALRDLEALHRTRQHHLAEIV